MNIIKLPPYNYLGPAPIKTKKQPKIRHYKKKKAKMIDKTLIAETIDHQRHLRAIMDEST